MSANVYAVVLNWNGWKDTLECLESLFRSDYGNLTVIVCDNASDDHSMAFIKTWANGQLNPTSPAEGPLRSLSYPPVSKPIPYVEYTREQAERGGTRTDSAARLILINTGGNLGFAGGNNIGLRYALSRDDFSYAWLLNNDTVVCPSALSALVQHMDRKQNAGLCGSTVRYYHHPDRVQAHGGASYHKCSARTALIGHMRSSDENVDVAMVESRLDCVLGASMLMSRAFLRTVGLMSEDYFLYYEEVDWALRARGTYQLSFCPQSVVYHKEGASIGSGSWTKLQATKVTYYNARNRLRITAKFFPVALPLVWLALLQSAVGRIVRGQLYNALIIFRVMFGLRRVP